MRTATIERSTKETSVAVTVDLDGSGRYDIATGVGFFDHMMEQLARHSLMDITLRAKGDLHIDDHHTVEDCGIALGQAIRKALGVTGGHATLTRAPDALRAALDVFEPLSPALMKLTRGVKASFDPQGLFNPGRMYAEL